MKLSLNNNNIPPAHSTAEQITFNQQTFNGYPYLILALLDKVPQLRELSDEMVTHYHNAVREILINQQKDKIASPWLAN